MRYLIALVLLLTYQNATAQQYLFNARYITVDDGLSNLMTTAIHKDRQGFIWIGTRYGLNRYDGYNFELFTKEKNNLLSNEHIHEIVSDDKGLLWLFSYSNRPLALGHYFFDISLFDPKTERAVEFEAAFKNKKLPFDPKKIYRTFCNDSKNRVWLITNAGEGFVYQNGEFIKKFQSDAGYIHTLNIDKNDHIWVSYKHIVQHFDKKGKLLEQLNFPERPVHKIFPTDSTLYVAQKNESNGKVYLRKRDQTGRWADFVFKKNSQPFTPEFLDFNMLHLSETGFWIVNDRFRQLMVFDAKGRLKTDYQTLTNTLFNSQATNFTEDNGTIWITSPVGVVQLQVKKSGFNTIPRHEKGFSDCRGIVEGAQGNIYFSNTKLYRWDKKTNTVKKTSSKNVAGALINMDGGIWSSCYSIDTLGYLINTTNGLFYTYISKDLLKSVVNAVVTTPKKGLYLAATNRGLCYLNRNKQSVEDFEGYGKFAYLDNLSIAHLLRDTLGTWVASPEGIFFINSSGNITRHFNKKNGDLPFDNIRHIYKDAEGVFWLSTTGGGLIKWIPSFSKNKCKFQHFSTKNGLPNNYPYAVLEDDYDRLWIPSDKGLLCFNKETNDVIVYTTADGLPHNEFNSTSYFKASDGQMYLGGLGGLINFHPRDLDGVRKNDTPLQFTGFYLLERRAKALENKTIALRQNNHIAIRPNDKFIELRFALLDYGDRREHSYAYKIEGFSETWNYINENFIRITYLPYGKYTIKIRGKNGAGWSENELTLNITVLKPFYFQTWFLLLILIILGALVAAYIRYRTLRLQLQKKLLQKEVELRTAQIQQDKRIIERQAIELRRLDELKSQFFINIAHELRTPLTLILAPIQELLQLEKLPEVVQQRLGIINKNGKQLLNSVDELLDFSKLEAGKLQVRELALEWKPFVEKCFKNFENYAEFRQINWTLEYNITTPLVLLTDAIKVERIINNLLSNALKYTSNLGSVTCRVQQQADKVLVQVIDDGQGIDAQDLPRIFERYYQPQHNNNMGGVGIGLALSQEYAKLLGGSISVVSQLGVGSTFTLELPAKVTDLTPQAVSSEQKDTLSENTLKETDNYTILVAEDNYEMAQYIKQALSAKYHILLTDNGKSALEILHTTTVDLIISDVSMPEMNGMELLQAVKRKIQWQHLPFILLTARIETESRLKALRIGVDDYITKPFILEELQARVQNLLENYSNRKSVQDLIQPNLDGKISVEEEWLKTLQETVLANLSDKNYNIARLALDLNISERNLFNKVKNYIGVTPGVYLREARLMQAKALLENRIYETVAEVCYAVGFEKTDYFTKIFKERFGKKPSEYKNK